MFHPNFLYPIICCYVEKDFYKILCSVLVLPIPNFNCNLTQTTSTVIMSVDLYTHNIPLTQKATFWSNYVSALKGRNIFVKESI